jgi:PKD repeat protein
VGGGGGRRSSAVTTHVFAAPGSYPVTLATTNACGAGTPVSKTLVVGTPAAAAFTSTSPVCAGVPMLFTDVSTGAVSAWSWSFGDGGTSTAQHPSHVYAAAGGYVVTLTTTGSCGVSTTNRTVSVLTAAPTAGFVPDRTTACVGSPICFTDGSSGASAWYWDFGTGTDFSSLPSPCFAWDQPGSYTVRLVTTNACGASVPATRSVTVTPPPTASFSVSAQGDKFCKGNQVTFTDTSTGAPTSWAWDFGDGTTSTLQNPTKTYSIDGVFVVRLVATNSCGASLPTFRTVTIAASCHTNCSANSRQISCSAGTAVTVDGDTSVDFDNYDTSFYECRPDLFYSGANATFELAAVIGSTYRVTLQKTGTNPSSYELDLLLSTGCNPPRCVGWGDSQLEFDSDLFPPDQQNYFLVVDGRNGTAGPFRLTVECIPPAQQGSCVPPTFSGVASAVDASACATTGIRVDWNAVTSWGAARWIW